MAGQAVLPLPVGASEQGTGLVVGVVAVAAAGAFDVFDGGVRGFGTSVRDTGGDGDLDVGPPGGDRGGEPGGFVGASSGRLGVEAGLGSTGLLDGGAGQDQPHAFFAPMRRPTHRLDHHWRTPLRDVIVPESLGCRSRVVAVSGVPRPGRSCGLLRWWIWWARRCRTRGRHWLPSWTRWNGSTAMWAFGRQPVMAFLNTADGSSATTAIRSRQVY